MAPCTVTVQPVEAESICAGEGNCGTARTVEHPFECHRDVLDRTMRKRLDGGGSLARRVARTVTWGELQAHDTDGDMWLSVHGYVYDVTRWLHRHPGGAEILRKFAGHDCTDQFDAFHQPKSAAMLANFLVGRLEPAEEAGRPQRPRPRLLPATKAYRRLREHLWRTGMFEADPTFFVAKDLVALAFFCAGLGVLTYGGKGAGAVLLGAFLVGMAIQQAAFVAHDALHNGVVKPGAVGSTNWQGWLHGSVIFGVSSRMWLEEHSIHHAITRRPCEDPQFDYLPLWLISAKEVQGKNARKVDFVTKQLTRIQHFTCLPLAVVVGRFNLFAISFAYVAQRGYFVDALGLVLHLAWFSQVVSLVPAAAAPGAWPWLRIAFMLVCYSTVGILHVQLLVNHMGVDAFTQEEERELQFFKFQMLTTRNTSTSWYDAWFHGGLENQIEHHLFPQLPRHRLGEVSPMVKQICAEHGVPFVSIPFSESVRSMLQDLRSLATHLVTMDVADLG